MSGIKKLFGRAEQVDVLDPASEALIKSLEAQKQLGAEHFESGPTLGTGTFGRVFVAKYKETGAYVAVKKLKKVEVLRLKQVEHVMNEKAILLGVTHPFIVNLWATFQDLGSLYLVMEFVQGGEVFSHLRKLGRFSPEITRVFSAEVCLALEHLHSFDVIYRDLKPENLLLDSGGHIKITDFGFAKVVKDKTWTLCGTPEYLCPEIIQSKGHGFESDWWAFGVLLFEFLAGYPPFFDENPFGIYEKILACRIPFPSFFDANAKDIIKKLCQADRTKRLGCVKNGVAGVKKHKFYKGLDWKAIAARTENGPIPISLGGAGDTSQFENYPVVPDEPLPAADPFKAIFANW